MIRPALRAPEPATVGPVLDGTPPGLVLQVPLDGGGESLVKRDAGAKPQLSLEGAPVDGITAVMAGTILHELNLIAARRASRRRAVREPLAEGCVSSKRPLDEAALDGLRNPREVPSRSPASDQLRSPRFA